VNFNYPEEICQNRTQPHNATRFVELCQGLKNLTVDVNATRGCHHTEVQTEIQKWVAELQVDNGLL
jgi:hypothetical protein